MAESVNLCIAVLFQTHPTDSTHNILGALNIKATVLQMSLIPVPIDH